METRCGEQSQSSWHHGVLWLWLEPVIRRAIKTMGLDLPHQSIRPRILLSISSACRWSFCCGFFEKTTVGERHVSLISLLVNTNQWKLPGQTLFRLKGYSNYCLLKEDGETHITYESWLAPRNWKTFIGETGSLVIVSERGISNRRTWQRRQKAWLSNHSRRCSVFPAALVPTRWAGPNVQPPWVKISACKHFSPMTYFM